MGGAQCEPFLAIALRFHLLEKLTKLGHLRSPSFLRPLPWLFLQLQLWPAEGRRVRWVDESTKLHERPRLVTGFPKAS